MSRNAHWHITDFDQFGELVAPSIIIVKYKTILGLLVRDFIPIKYRKWIGKDNDEWKVPESEKDAIWENMIPQYFTFPVDYDREQVKKKVKEIMGTCFKTFKGTLYKKYVLEVKVTDFDGGEYTKQRDLWHNFKEYKLSEEYLQLSRKNKQNSQKATNPHHLGSRGYAKKMPEFEAELHRMACLAEEDVQVETADWESRSILYCMAREVRHTPDGSFTSQNSAMSDLVQRISEVTNEVRQGTRTSNREKDVLTQALGNREHPGRTRGAGIVPWRVSFKEEAHTYRSRLRSRAEQEAKTLRRLKEIEERFDTRLEATVEARMQQVLQSIRSAVPPVPPDPIPTSFSPHFRGRSSCGSTPLNGEEANVPHPVDNITEPVNVRLYICQQWTTDKVAYGLAWPAGDGTVNGHPIPLGYANVSIDKIVDKKYNKIHIDYPTAKDRPKLG
jgi:hypothetical protein